MLFERYFGSEINLKRSYRNRLRNDQSAGCRFRYKNGILSFYDYSRSKVYDVIEWVKEEYGLTYYEALQKIANDFKYGTNNQVPMISTPYEITESKELKIQVNPKTYSEKFIKYFQKHLITPKTCWEENVYCVDEVYYDGQLAYKAKDELIIAYYFPDIDKLKILRPEQPKIYKWRTNVPNTYIDGLNQLDPNIKNVILLKSKKDKMLIKQLGFKNVLSTMMEGTFVITDETEKLLEKYNKIIWMDNDATGKMVSKHYEDKGWNPILWPDWYTEFGVKDPTDYSRVFQETSTITELLNEKLKND